MSFRSLQGDPAEKVIAYNYDAAGRLIGSQHGDNAHRYSVDAAGNRLAPQDNQQALPDNRLTQLNGARYRYDGAGNLIERLRPNGERLTLGYDGANRLVHLIHASELGYTREATYRYDGLGRRISKTVRHTNGTTATTHYGWNGDRIVREETDNQRTTVVYEPSSFVPMLRIDDTQQGQILSAYITDALGTPMQLVTPSGTTRWQAQPDDWAAIRNERGNTPQPIRFQGQWHDEESGLYYNRHRYYDPQQGRYISQDPIGLNGGTNLYGYVTNPTGMVDPLGLETTVTIWRPVGRGASSFGHVSTSINDTTYTYGPGGMSVVPTSEYISDNTDFRLGRGIHLDLTEEEEELLQNCMSNHNSSYNTLTNNCGTPVQNCLKQLGYDLGRNILPVSLGFSLLDSELFSGSEFYYPTKESEENNTVWPFEGSTAPWAK
ncbi:MAG: RHS domain-containing protein [Halomonas sp.]|nr:RHS repeat-associated core domain-containing protein [Halomonas sp.]MCC5901444.1 RHS domain-containing protein [Halomonas sp.]